MNPKEIALKLGIPETRVRRILRKVFGVKGKGTKWNISPEEVNRIFSPKKSSIVKDITE